MALGENIGYSTLLAQNNTASLYQASNNYGSGMVHIALMGDLTLRTDYIKPVSNVGLMAIAGAGAKVTWSSSPDPAVVGYYVYRSADEYGTYKKRSGLITGTNFTDSFGTTGQYYYMVRAAKLQNTPSGGYYNLSLGVVSAPATIVYPKPDLGITVETPSESTVTIYPNPAHDKLNIVINSGTTTMATIQITDQMGRLLITKTTSLHTGDNTITSDISMFPQGVYYVSVAYNDVMKTVKWVKY
jgi:hypothetical protein